MYIYLLIDYLYTLRGTLRNTYNREKCAHNFRFNACLIAQSLFTFQTEDRMREVGQREDRDAEALRYGKALCKFVFTSFYLLTTRYTRVIHTLFEKIARRIVFPIGIFSIQYDNTM